MTPINTDLIPAINDSLQLDLPQGISFESLKEELASRINRLIESDFNKLISILYRVDVNESRLKHLLKENPGVNAADILADLVIERQLEKIRSRQQFSNRDKNISDDEKW
ncbi:MAG TPA: hypothetical protein VJ765_11860 [Chitinophagaceae bacterium]|nr:hypothetical protein [Chitinophagaceae bacterium]